MAFIPTPGAALVMLNYRKGNESSQNTLWFYNPTQLGGWDVASLSDLCNQVEDWWATEIAPLVCSEVSLNNIEAVDQAQQDGPAYVLGSLGVGARVDDPLPSSVTWCVSFKTAGRGRHTRGRNYVVGLGTGQIEVATGDYIAATPANAYVAAYAELNTYVQSTAPQTTHSIVSRFFDNAPRSNGVVYEVLTYTYADLALDVRRPRAAGRGA